MIKQKYDDIAEVIEEKFTRCPRCRHYSVKQTNNLSFKERMKARFLPVTAYICDNCSYRFVEEGEFPTGLKGFFAVLVSRLWTRYLLITVTLVAAAVVVIIILLSASGDKKPNFQVENDRKTGKIEQKQMTQPDQPVEKKTGEVEEKPPEDTGEKDAPVMETTEIPGTTETGPEEKEPIFDIILGNSNRFGVNWRVVKDGVQITRMSEGPLKKAGLKIGDVLSDVDDRKITTGNYLLRMRNEIFYGRRTEVLIKVYREGKLHLYKMVKTKTPSTSPGTDANDTRKSIDTDAIHVFKQNTIKLRSSAPDTVSKANKWCFLKKEVKVRREPHQHVYVAGDSTGTLRWAVDDRLIISGKEFEGLCQPYEKSSGYLPDEAKCLPLDITDLVPPNLDIVLTVELADHGIHWANTDIYIVVK
ncbi:MAG: PDZ domain-containing protein [Candidatus Aminicenantes bacterium]|nr:PDZ domain-containing protein [Candidatus Aminicenantes bacterium]NIM83982.1 PDZ domain-containing protein [Candidatus Aminicenantes bacterium]NIN23460.1 PDZ domain-containing protein [Candidatus Aminicenantes bacterium]NIN47165.1 PDZ domain-containing protein [Candidatus Aminicenantes bacterium]NIN90089.1 PDZ domain-containing protein [Candidatus Aminicenantes bacterium]